jgi:CheY-like chemotaxis protein
MKINPQLVTNQLSDAELIRILCVDDNSALLRTMTTGLTIYGFEVVSACDGIDALRKFINHSGKFAAIVTDDDMPQMNGLELVRYVREQKFKGPIFLISGDLRPPDLEHYYLQDICGFLQKPFKVRTLATLIETSLVSALGAREAR